jgi:hypothetical protein
MQLIEPTTRNQSENAAIATLHGVPETILALLECQQACLACADLCTTEVHGAQMRRTIRLSLDCAAICQATTSILSRSVEPDWRVLGAQLQTCIIACEACADECELHALDHTHCRLCAEATRTCERICTGLMAAVPATLP